MRRDRWVGLAAGAAVVVAALALLVGSAFAEPPTPGATPNAKQDRGRYAQVFLSKLAGILGVDEAKLKDSIKQAASQTVDQAVQDGELTQEQATKLKERIQKAEPGALGFGHFGLRGGPHARGPHRGPAAIAALGRDVHNAIAQKLGMTADQLHQELRSGKTLDQIAQEKGVTKQDLGQAAADAAKPKLDEAVKNGRITQQQADQILQQLRSGDILHTKGHLKGRPFPPGQQKRQAPSTQGTSF
ncbi:MAG: hypothetical protein HY331_03390 [Chloroflexi bacterium]|nr:hypothetical protein [Chloroflexota bacterium]